MSTTRSRWSAIGAAVAVTLGAGGIGLVSATNPSDATAYVPITPCRAADTRPQLELNKGPRDTPIGAETHQVATGDGDCAGNIPGSATGVQLNVTALDATLPTFLTIWGAGAQPDASSLNPVPDAPPTPNAVTSGLDGDSFNIYNFQGHVNVVVDIVGYYTDHNHDDRYYTKGQTYSQAEVDAAVNAAKSVAVSANNNGSMAVAQGDPVKSAVSVTVNAPAGGTVVVNANGYAGDTGTGNVGVRCAINDSVAIDFSYLLYATGDFPGQTRPLSGTRAFPVAQGDSLTIHLACDANDGSGYIQDRSMTAIFVPD